MHASIDPTAAALLATVPLYQIPPFGGSPEIDGLRASNSGYGFALGSDGLMAIYRRPWLALDMRMPIAELGQSSVGLNIPYGQCWADHLEMRCGKIPAAIYHQLIAHFIAALPVEAAGFALWNEATGEWRFEAAQALHATPSSIRYVPPIPEAGWHIVLDAHSHGAGPAFFSSVDDRDDQGATKISMVVGSLRPGDLSPDDIQYRVCANGALLPINKSPFEEVQ